MFFQSFKTRVTQDLAFSEFSKDTLNRISPFIVNGEFACDQLIRSGQLIYNKDFDKYLNSLIDLLVPEKELRSKIKPFLCKSVVCNAYAFPDGMVIVTTQMLERLQNEQELAFVLCHEISHVSAKHSIRSYLNVFKSNDNKISQSNNDRLLKSLHFSRKLESEADSLGLIRYLKAGFQSDYAYKQMKMLGYTRYAQDGYQFYPSLFEDKYYRFPAEYRLNAVDSVTINEDENDSLSTHPSTSKRALAIQKWAKSPGGGAAALTRKEDPLFHQMQEMCRFENIRLQLIYLNYPEVIYSALRLQKDYPQNAFLKEAISMSLYEMAVYKAIANTNPCQTNSCFEDKDYQYKPEYFEYAKGDVQRVHYFIHKLSGKEAIALALRYSWGLYKEGGYQNQRQSRMCDSLVNMMQTVYGNDFSYLINPDSSVSTGITGKTRYVKGALYTLRDDVELQKRFQSQQEAQKTRTVPGKITKVVVVDPFYFLVLTGGKYPVLEHESSEELNNSLMASIQSGFDESLLPGEILNPRKFGLKESDSYSDMAALNDWFNEKVNHADNCKSLVLNLSQEEVNRIMSKYGTSFFMWTGIIHEKKTENSFKYKANAFSILIDLKTNKVIRSDYSSRTGSLFDFTTEYYKQFFSEALLSNSNSSKKR